jgi:hypothetical protein
MCTDELKWRDEINGIINSQHFCYYEVNILLTYEGELVHMSQMNMKRKTCDVRTWKQQLFLDISSTNTDTLVPTFYQCVEIRSIGVF